MIFLTSVTWKPKINTCLVGPNASLCVKFQVDSLSTHFLRYGPETKVMILTTCYLTDAKIDCCLGTLGVSQYINIQVDRPTAV